MGLAQPAIDSIRNHDGFLNAALARIKPNDERRIFQMVFTDRPSTETAGGVSRAVAVNTITHTNNL
jgi:hypothetical protein